MSSVGFIELHNWPLSELRPFRTIRQQTLLAVCSLSALQVSDKLTD